jgi:hypothetical protein
MSPFNYITVLPGDRNDTPIKRNDTYDKQNTISDVFNIDVIDIRFFATGSSAITLFSFIDKFDQPSGNDAEKYGWYIYTQWLAIHA